MLMCTREREALVAETQEFADVPMDDMVIRNMFSELNMKLGDLDPNMPPSINPSLPELGQNASFLKLVYTAMALQRMKDLKGNASKQKAKAAALAAKNTEQIPTE